MGVVLHSEVCCGGHRKSFGHHGHSHHSNSNQRHSHNRNSHRSNNHNSQQNSVDLSYSPLIEEGSDQEMELESPVAEIKPKHVHHKNINVRAAFIHVIGDIIQSVGVLIASFIIKFMVSEYTTANVDI